RGLVLRRCAATLRGADRKRPRDLHDTEALRADPRVNRRLRRDTDVDSLIIIRDGNGSADESDGTRALARRGLAQWGRGEVQATDQQAVMRKAKPRQNASGPANTRRAA